MSKVAWPAVLEKTVPVMVTGRIWRVVESQQQVATNELVDNLAEQILLEQLLETSKPAYPAGCERLHYLLRTPFRYPPLRWGSRFGSTFEPGIYYAAHTQQTALAESAFYRLLFFDGMQQPLEKLTSQHLLFAARCHTQQGIKLHQPPLVEYTRLLTDPVSYLATQALGRVLRAQDYAAIEFISARDHQSQGLNVALLQPAAMRSRRPEVTLRVLAQTTAAGVAFKLEERLLEFPLAQFLVNGCLPKPG